MITIKTCTVCSLLATEDAIGHSCRSSDNRKVSRDPLSTKLGMQPDCSIHLLSFRNWRPTGSFWRMMVNFWYPSWFALLTREIPFCRYFPVVEDIKKGLFLKLLFQGWNLYVFVLFIQKNPLLIKSYWENEWQKSFSFKSTMHINAHQVWTHTIPFAHGQVNQKMCFYKEMMK